MSRARSPKLVAAERLPASLSEPPCPLADSDPTGQARVQPDPSSLERAAGAIVADADHDPRGYLQRTNTYQHGE